MVARRAPYPTRVRVPCTYAQAETASPSDFFFFFYASDSLYRFYFLKKILFSLTHNNPSRGV